MEAAEIYPPHQYAASPRARRHGEERDGARGGGANGGGGERRETWRVAERLAARVSPRVEHLLYDTVKRTNG